MAMTDDARELGREWRDGVQRDIRDLVTSTQNLNTAVAELRKIAEAHQERIQRMEQRPASTREWVLAAVAIASALITLGGHISLH